MSKKGVAEAIGVTPNTIHRYETGESSPPDETAEKLAVLLKFPAKFFYGKDVDEPRRDNASFRGMANKSGKVMDAALASGALAFLLDDWIGAEFYRSEVNLLELPQESPEAAAMMLRQHWQLGDKPIKNMVHLLEANGVRVFSLAENTMAVDAFSLWRDNIPYVFLNRQKSAERSRFDAAHELAHLCLHRHGGALSPYQDSAIEKQANAFAGAFLMPETDLKTFCTGQLIGVDHLVRFKRRWRVSAAALNYRANEIGLIPEGRCNSNYVEMSRRGWLKREPDGIAREQSFVWQEIINDLNGRGITKSKIADFAGVPPAEIEALLFGLANMMPIDGNGGNTPRRHVELRLIKS